jgi:hypothetical protein
LGNLVDYDQVELVEINKFNQSNFSLFFLKLIILNKLKKLFMIYNARYWLWQFTLFNAIRLQIAGSVIWLQLL